MFLMVGPERYSAPPVETWTMPSEPASAKPWRAAFRVCEDDTLMAGKAKPCDFAASSISAYFSGVAMGMGNSSAGLGEPDFTLVAATGSIEGRPHAGTECSVRRRAANLAA